MAKGEPVSGTAGAHRDHPRRMERSRESSPYAVLAEMDRDWPQRLHVRCTTAACQERDSISKNTAGSMTPRQFGRDFSEQLLYWARVHHLVECDRRIESANLVDAPTSLANTRSCSLQVFTSNNVRTRISH